MNIDLIGSIASTSSLTGDTSGAVPLAASVDSVSSLSGDLSTTVPLLSSVGAASSVAGDLVTALPLAASIDSASNMSGDLLTTTPLEASIDAASSLSGDLVSTVPLESSVDGISDVSGEVSSEVPLAGFILSATSLDGDMETGATMSGTIDATTSLDGDMVSEVPLTGSLDAESTVFADPATVVPIDGSLWSSSDISGDVVSTTPIDGSISEVSSVDGYAFRYRFLPGVIQAVSSLSGEMPVETGPISGLLNCFSRLRATLVPTFSVAHETEHTETGLARLIEQFRSKSNLSSILTSFLSQVQGVEDGLYSLLLLRGVYSSTGVQLDGIGAILDEPREGDEDEAYRERLLIKVLLNTCDGSPEKIIEIFSKLTSGAPIELTEFQPAAFTLWIKYAVDMTDSDGDGVWDQVKRFADYLQAAKPAAVSARLLYQNTTTGKLKRFDTVGQGFDYGKYAGVI